MSKMLKDEFPSIIDIAYREYTKYKHVSDIMTRNVITVNGDVTIYFAAKVMEELRIGSLVVEEEGRAVGIFTERDLLSKIASRDLPIDVAVEKYASSPFVTISSGMSIHRAALTMAIKYIRRLPVERDEEIVGIITARDLVEAYAR